MDYAEARTAWGRASVLGEPGAPVVASALGVFEPGLIASLYDAGRQACSLADVRSAKESGAVAALRHVLGDTGAGISAEVESVLAVLRRVAAAASATGRALHSGLTALPWPTDPLGQLWHACSILREHCGDGHVAAYIAARLSGLEANLLTEAKVGWEPLSYTGSRGWSPDAMKQAAADLAERGLLCDDGLTPAGQGVSGGDRADHRPARRSGDPGSRRTARRGRRQAERVVAADHRGWLVPARPLSAGLRLTAR